MDTLLSFAPQPKVVLVQRPSMSLPLDDLGPMKPFFSVARAPVAAVGVQKAVAAVGTTTTTMTSTTTTKRAHAPAAGRVGAGAGVGVLAVYASDLSPVGAVNDGVVPAAPISSASTPFSGLPTAVSSPATGAAGTTTTAAGSKKRKTAEALRREQETKLSRLEEDGCAGRAAVAEAREQLARLAPLLRKIMAADPSLSALCG